MNVGPLEIMVIMVVALLVFGPHRLPEVARQVGGALRELRKMQDTVRGELDMVLHPEHGTTTSSSATRVEPEDHTALAAGSDPDTSSPDAGSYADAGSYEAVDSGDTTSASYDGAEWSDSDWSDNGVASENGIGDANAADDRRFAGPPDSFI